MKDIFLAGDTSGFEIIRPADLSMMNNFNCLYSYGHPKGIQNTDEFIFGGISKIIMVILLLTDLELIQSLILINIKLKKAKKFIQTHMK